jgi:hypothetical protein
MPSSTDTRARPQVDDKKYWSRDMDVRCWSAEHLAPALPVFLFGLLVLCIAVPCVHFFGMLHHSRRKQKAEGGMPGPKEKQFMRRYGFLYTLYKDELCCWEAVVIVQTVIMVCVNLFVRQYGTYYQLLMLILVIAASNSMVHVFQPYLSRQLHVLYLAGTSCLLLTCIGVLALLRKYTMDGREQDERVRNIVAAVVVLLNGGFIAWCLFEIVRSSMNVAAGWVAVAKSFHAWHKSGRRWRSFKLSLGSTRAASQGGVAAAAAPVAAAQDVTQDHEDTLLVSQLELSSCSVRAVP